MHKNEVLIFPSFTKNKNDMWIARDRDGSLWLFKRKPKKNIRHGIWCVNDDNDMNELEEDKKWMFPSVKWEDNEPTEIILTMIPFVRILY